MMPHADPQTPPMPSAPPPAGGPPVGYRTIFLSDLHLGAFGARADLLLEFLQKNPAGRYLLVGDILDIWHGLRPAWGADQQRIIDFLTDRHAAGAEVIYVRGNHDPCPETAPAGRGLPVAAITQTTHQTADGRRYLVIHGDGQDPRLLQSLVLRRIGAQLEQGLRRLDGMLRRLRDRQDDPHRRSMIERVIGAFNAAICTGRGNERKLVALAAEAGLDGVICGHFHIPALHRDHGLTYANCGDWVDNMTAIVEEESGRLRLIAACPVRARAAAGRRGAGYGMLGA